MIANPYSKNSISLGFLEIELVMVLELELELELEWLFWVLGRPPFAPFTFCFFP